MRIFEGLQIIGNFVENYTLELFKLFTDKEIENNKLMFFDYLHEQRT